MRARERAGGVPYEKVTSAHSTQIIKTSKTWLFMKHGEMEIKKTTRTAERERNALSLVRCHLTVAAAGYSCFTQFRT